MLIRIHEAEKKDFFVMTDMPLHCPKCGLWTINGGVGNTAKHCPECGANLREWLSYDDGEDGSGRSKHLATVSG